MSSIKFYWVPLNSIKFHHVPSSSKLASNLDPLVQLGLLTHFSNTPHPSKNHKSPNNFLNHFKSIETGCVIIRHQFKWKWIPTHSRASKLTSSIFRSSIYIWYMWQWNGTNSIGGLAPRPWIQVSIRINHMKYMLYAVYSPRTQSIVDKHSHPHSHALKSTRQSKQLP